MRLTTIDRRSGLSYADFEREYLQPRRPVILTDALEQCPARTRWTPGYFKERFGERRVRTDGGEMRVAELIDRVLDPNQPPPFLRERPLPWLLPDVLPDLGPFPLAARPNWLEYPFANWPDLSRRGFASMLVRLAQTDINLTGANVRFPYLHLDRFRCHAAIMQWYGRKEFFVFAPEDGENIYAKAEEDVSQISNVEDVDLQRFPKFANANMIRFTLNPGETLFNPSGWWHTTRTLDVSIATVISFANGSNWNYLIRHMLPRGGWKGKLVFAPYAAYLFALGLLRLPFWRPPDASDPATAAAAQKRFDASQGAWTRSASETKYVAQ
jgi:histone arginine demethylase JMJD6